MVKRNTCYQREREGIVVQAEGGMDMICHKTGIPYSWEQAETWPSIMRGWVTYVRCPICGEVGTLETSWGPGDETWGGRRMRREDSEAGLVEGGEG